MAKNEPYCITLLRHLNFCSAQLRLVASSKETYSFLSLSLFIRTRRIYMSFRYKVRVFKASFGKRKASLFISSESPTVVMSRFELIAIYAVVMTILQLLFEAPKLPYMLSGDYMFFAPIPGFPISNSAWWWLVWHLISSLTLAYFTTLYIFSLYMAQRAAAASSSTQQVTVQLNKVSGAYHILVQLVLTSILVNSMHFGPAPSWVAVLFQGSLVWVLALTSQKLYQDCKLAVFYIVLTSPTLLTVAVRLFYGEGISYAFSFFWTGFMFLYFVVLTLLFPRVVLQPSTISSQID